jgi:sarcosine oxidase subunit gamma
MSDALARKDPVSTAAFVGEGVAVSLAEPMARYSLRARHVHVLEALLGAKVPTAIGEMQGGIACLGPDEWLLRAPAGTTSPQGDGLPVSITEVSERAVCLTVAGPRAAEVLMSGCPLDLHRFAAGRATRTVFETVEITLLRKGEELFEVEVWRSFAPWLKAALEAAAD